MSDEMVSIPRPVESPGFCSAVILNANISIATITGRIIKSKLGLLSTLRCRSNMMAAVYSHRKQSEDRFVSEVREILLSLAHARQGMPLDCVMNFSSPCPLTRNCITLNLMLYQVSSPFPPSYSSLKCRRLSFLPLVRLSYTSPKQESRIKESLPRMTCSRNSLGHASTQLKEVCLFSARQRNRISSVSPMCAARSNT